MPTPAAAGTFPHVGSLSGCGGNPLGTAACRGTGNCGPGCSGCGAHTHWNCCGSDVKDSKFCLPGISQEQAARNVELFGQQSAVPRLIASIPGVAFPTANPSATALGGGGVVAEEPAIASGASPWLSISSRESLLGKLNYNDVSFISSMLPSTVGPPTELLFSCADNGWSSTVFHSRCDLQGPTLLLVRFDRGLLAAFTSVPWQSATGDQHVTDPTSFLCSITPAHQKLNRGGGDIVTFTNPLEYGPAYGFDLYFNSTMQATFQNLHFDVSGFNDRQAAADGAKSIEVWGFRPSDTGGGAGTSTASIPVVSSAPVLPTTTTTATGTAAVTATATTAKASSVSATAATTTRGQGCDAACTSDHFEDGKCLACNQEWGVHLGHTCPNSSTRGSWRVGNTKKQDKEMLRDLHRASLAGDVGKVQETLSLDPSSLLVNKRGDHGRTALHVAAGANRDDVVSVLLQSGADIHMTDRRGWSALHEAAHASSGNICQILIDAGASKSQKDNKGSTPHDVAVRNHADTLVQSILDESEVLHPGKMKCACGHQRGELSWPLTSTDVHLNTKCLWTCCGLAWSSTVCRGTG